MKYYSTFLVIFLLSIKALWAQRDCGSEEYYQKTIKAYPELKERLGVTREIQADRGQTIVIPIAVHIVFNKPEQNLTDEQIASQIKVLNEDFSGTNADIMNVPEPFRKSIAGNTGIKFVLGAVTRTFTNKDEFVIDLRGGGINPANEAIKFTSEGGHDAMLCTQVMNMWVGNIRKKGGGIDGLAGYATFPGGPCEYDGVVIHYKYFGTVKATAPLDKGRTATHETGHWLNLHHIWGDADCGDDLVDDTPAQDKPNFQCPPFPQANCLQTQDGEMYMDYMDYVDDQCMCMFTRGQSKRMRSVFTEFTLRASFLINVEEKFRNLVNINGFTIDINFPVVNTIKQATNFAIAEWQKSSYSKKYIFLLKPVKNNQWDTISIADNKIRIEGLTPGGLYEVKVVTQLDNHISLEGPPYMFVADKGFIVPRNGIKLMNTF